MKKRISMLMAIAFILLGAVGCNAETGHVSEKFTLTLQVGNPVMTVNGDPLEIDQGRGTAPVVVNDRTLVPIRAVIEAMGGAVHWEQDTQNIIIALGENVIMLTIGNRTAYVNSEAKTLDTPPAILNDRTLLPIRFISESLGYQVDWNEAEQLITINKGSEQQNEPVSYFDLSQGRNAKAPVVALNSGYDMPVLGIGTYSLLGESCVSSVSTALQNGYRLIDTAYIYNNEESVGEGIKSSGVPREEVFVTTKLYMNQYANADQAIDEALARLGVDYIDLMLLHHPGAQDAEAYRAMEAAVRDGKIRSIGLSNYYINEIEEFLPQVTIMPALVQNEIHPYYQESEVIQSMHDKGIIMEAWYPLGGRWHTAELLSSETIRRLAQAHHKSAAQIILRWHLQRGVVAIPGSSNPSHIKENISVFDFELTRQEMEQINALDRNEKHDWY